MLKKSSFTFLLLIVAVMAGFFLSYPAATAQATEEVQIITLSPEAIAAAVPPNDGHTFTVSVMYDVSNDDNTLSGIDLSVHFDSSKLTFDSYSYFREEGDMKSPPTELVDEDNEDNDPGTDKRINMNWTSFTGSWPGADVSLASPIKLADLVFSVNQDAQTGATPLNISIFDSPLSTQLFNAVVTISRPPTQIKITSDPLSVDAGVKGDMAVSLQDDLGDPSAATTDVVVDLSSDSAKGTFYNVAGDTVITSVTIPAGSTSAEFKYYDETAGTPTVAVSADGLTGGHPAADHQPRSTCCPDGGAGYGRYDSRRPAPGIFSHRH